MFNYYLDVVTKKYAEFNGRARRSEFWYFTLFNTIISYSLSLGVAAISPTIGLVGSTIYSFATLLPSIAVGIRRMHDAGKSGWFGLIPFYNLYLACQDSILGQNEYGPNPKGFGNNMNDDQLIKSIGTQL